MARIDDYKESFRLAANELKQSDLADTARKAGVELNGSAGGGTELRVPFLGAPFIVRVGEEVDVVREGDDKEVSLPEKILICHYLLHASGLPPAGELITFRQVPDGHFYYDAFQRRARDPFLSSFGQSGELFRTCAQMLGANPVETGDVGMVFRVFPLIPVQLVLWAGDDEFPPEAGILLDATIARNLSAEDIAVMSGMLVYKLMGIARSVQSASQAN